MNGAHDMGGMHGFGPIDPEPETAEPVFHEPWERRAFALTLAVAGLGRWTLDEARHARERIPPARYLELSYYEKWLEALSKQIVEKGLVTEAEVASGRPAARVSPETVRVLRGADVPQLMAKGGPTAMPLDRAPAFRIGDRVRARNMHPAGHTRLPRYVRGHAGTVVLHHGGHVFADANAHGERRAEHLYTVSFATHDLWGPAAGEKDSVRIDLWEPHLEPA